MRYRGGVEKDIPGNPKNVKFADLLRLCTKYFGSPRIRGSHHIFRTPWQGDPRINIQKDGNMAKEYQVRAVVRAIERLKAEAGGEKYGK
jgi:CRP-like cAMP-binding protein